MESGRSAADEFVVRSCPRCAYAAADLGLKCPQCGSLVVAPPATAPVAAEPVHATPYADTPVAPTCDEQFFTPATFTPIERPAVASNTARPRPWWPALVAVVIVLVIAYSARGLVTGGSHAAKTPVILPPHGATTGIPSLSDAVRVQAESSRQVAFSAISEVYAESGPPTVELLQGRQPSLTFVGANDQSTGPHVVSFATTNDTATIAIGATNHDVCAFGRLPYGGVGQYVTESNVSSCTAADAPTTGWSDLAGGSGSDLPADGY